LASLALVGLAVGSWLLLCGCCCVGVAGVVAGVVCVAWFLVWCLLLVSVCGVCGNLPHPPHSIQSMTNLMGWVVMTAQG